MNNKQKTMEKIVALCKNRGFVFPGSEIYGGLANSWDYGPLGVEMKNNVKRAWWKKFVQENPYNVGLDAAILMNPQVWVASGHVSTFNDPPHRLQGLQGPPPGGQAGGGLRGRARPGRERGGHDPGGAGGLHPGQSGALPGVRQERLHRHPQVQPDVQDPPGRHRGHRQRGVPAAGDRPGHLRELPRHPADHPPQAAFGVCQVGKSFRNEITPGNFIFRIREFEQMELEFFCKPGTDPGVVPVLADLLPRLADGPEHQGGEPAPAGPRARGAGLLLQGHHGLRVPVPLRLGRAVGRGGPHPTTTSSSTRSTPART